MSVGESVTTSLTGTWIMELSGEVYQLLMEKLQLSQVKNSLQNVFEGCRTCNESVSFLQVLLNVSRSLNLKQAVNLKMQFCTDENGWMFSRGHILTRSTFPLWITNQQDGVFFDESKDTYTKRAIPVFAMAKERPRMPLPTMALLRLNTDIPKEVVPGCWGKGNS